MFLFSTPPGQQTQKAETPLSRPIAQAAQETGVPFDYLVKTAKRESGMNPEAKAPNSSATGLFQFIEQTWLGLVKRQGGNMGLEDAASQITQDRSGRYVVSDPSTRQQILALRKDPSLSSKMAGVFTAENRDSLKNALGRDPTGGELYIAHFMGAGGAREFISQAANNPDRAAASSFPDAASANRSIFFDGKGRARTMREVYSRLISHHEGESAVQVAAVAPQATGAEADGGAATRSPLAIAAGGGRNQNAFSGLFRSAGNGEGAKAMRNAWVGVAQSRLNNAPSFFPRSDNAPVAQVASLEPTAGVLAKFEAQAPYEAVDLPLPPRRPENLAAAVNSPLDLTRYTKNRR